MLSQVGNFGLSGALHTVPNLQPDCRFVRWSSRSTRSTGLLAFRRAVPDVVSRANRDTLSQGPKVPRSCR
jgi:hypothetical protein